jgi:ribosomal protein S18 acetylase RimI-like enzyme
MHESYTVWYGSDVPRQLNFEEARAFVKHFFESTIYDEISLVSGPPGKIVSALLIERPAAGRSPRMVELFTHPLYRSRGLATSLVEECLSLLGKLSQPGLEAIVDPRNERIIRILRKLGFSESPTL